MVLLEKRERVKWRGRDTGRSIEKWRDGSEVIEGWKQREGERDNSQSSLRTEQQGWK